MGAIGVGFINAKLAGTNLTGTNMTGARLHKIHTKGLAPGANLAGVTYMPYQPVAGGYDHSCALNPAGHVRCWGDNSSGQLGNNTTTDSPTPTPVQVVDRNGQPLANITAISTGFEHSCALDTAGHVYCWGSNGYGQLGNNTRTDSPTPTPVQVIDRNGQPLANITAISTGAHDSCVLNTTGHVHCWGHNSSGQLGNNTITNSRIPVQVVDRNGQPLGNITAISTGAHDSCALDTGGHVHCWGYNDSGQLGNNTTAHSRIPVQVVGSSGAPLANVTAISTGIHLSCALDTAGPVYCWGSNYRGQLGNNTTTGSSTPVQVVDRNGQPLANITAISTGFEHSCVLDAGGHVYCWGRNYYGQLGNNTTVPSRTPVQVVDRNGQPLGNITAISTGFEHSCVLEFGGHVHCWGSNGSGQLGNNTRTDSPTPVQVVGREPFMLI